MTALHLVRAWHAVLVVLVAVTWVTGEVRLVHALLGYVVGLAILLRLAVGLVGRQGLGLQRFQPRFAGLSLGTAATHPAISKALLAGIAACLVAATLTGVALDGGQAFAMKAARHGHSLMKEGHEVLANLLLLLVGLHVAYLLAFKRGLARFMVFLPGAGAGPR